MFFLLLLLVISTLFVQIVNDARTNERLVFMVFHSDSDSDPELSDWLESDPDDEDEERLPDLCCLLSAPPPPPCWLPAAAPEPP